MNLENLTEKQIKDLNKTANKAAKALFEAMYGEFTDDELKFINDVLLGVKERSGGSVHVSFDHAELIKSKNKGQSVDDVLDEVFGIFDKVESGEIKTEPYRDEFSDGWCGPNCECYPDPATESKEDKELRLKKEAHVEGVIDKLMSGEIPSKPWSDY